MMISANEMAAKAGVSPKRFRAALRKQQFRWHSHYERWTVTGGGKEHTAMLRVLHELAVSQHEPSPALNKNGEADAGN